MLKNAQLGQEVDDIYDAICPEAIRYIAGEEYLYLNPVLIIYIYIFQEIGNWVFDMTLNYIRPTMEGTELGHPDPSLPTGELHLLTTSPGLQINGDFLCVCAEL